MNLKNKLEIVKQIYIFILLIISSCTVWGGYIYYKQFIFILLFSALIINGFNAISKKNLIIFGLFSSIILSNYFTWMNNIDGYLGLLIKGFSILLIANNIDYNRFKKYYFYFFSIYVLISFIGYYNLLNNWEVVSNIPIQNVWGSDMRPTFWYTFPVEEFYRNFGLYKEGGTFAIFINIALLFSFKVKETKYVKLTRITFLVAIATTLSTTGLIAAVIIILLNQIGKEGKVIKEIILLILLSVVILVIETNTNIISDKFTTDNASFISRSSEFSVAMEVMSDNILFGTGYQNSDVIKNYTNIENMTNGLLSVLMQFGPVLGIVIICMHIRGILNNANKNIKDSFLLTILFILFTSAQPVVFSPIFLMLIYDKTKYSNNLNIKNKLLEEV